MSDDCFDEYIRFGRGGLPTASNYTVCLCEQPMLDARKFTTFFVVHQIRQELYRLSRYEIEYRFIFFYLFFFLLFKLLERNWNLIADN